MGRDLAYALRVFRRAPGFTALVVATLAVGIGAITAVFSIFYSVLLAPLPFRDSGRLVAIWDREIHASGTSKLFALYSDYENWKRNSNSFDGVAAVTWSPQGSPSRILRGLGPARSVFALPVTAEFFSVLGVAPAIGRTFDASDIGRGCVVVLANGFWQHSFAGQTSAVGRTIRLNEQACTVLGAMPAGFAYLPPGMDVSMWTLMPAPDRPDEMAMAVFGRLRTGVPAAAAQAEISTLHHRIHEHDRWGAQMEPVVYDLHGEFTWLTGRNLRISLVVLFAAVSFVLLICCVNVANLLLGRAAGREREMAIRAALGSGRGRLLCQLLTESLAFSVSAAIAGAALAWGAVHYFGVARPIEMPPGAALGLSLPVLGFTAVMSIATASAFGLAPAWRGSRTDLNEALKAGSRGTSLGRRGRRVGKSLVVAELMLTVVLLAGAGMLLQTMSRFAAAPLGFDVDGLLTSSIRLPPNRYDEASRRMQFYERLEAEWRAMPGVQGVAISSNRPINGGGSQEVVEVQGRPEPGAESVHDAYQQTVSEDYFRVMGTSLDRGRGFESADRFETEPVAIINEALASKYFGKEDPVGMHIRPYNDRNRGLPRWRVVGVVGNEKRTTVYQEMAWAEAPVIYRPLRQNPMAPANAMIRVSAQSGALADGLRRRAAAVDPDVAIDDIERVRDLQAKAMAYPRFRALLLAGFAGLSLLLATVGLFGVMSQFVTQRTHEIGVRMAVGAQQAAVLRMILREGLILTGAGAVAGVGAVLFFGMYVRSLLYGASSAGLWQMAWLGGLFLAAALIAMYVPGRRASRVDPMIALRDC